MDLDSSKLEIGIIIFYVNNEEKELKKSIINKSGFEISKNSANFKLYSI